eukprot:CAMPEP_0183710126 /NCGR_PEP_ID=MMETSP0737-20130205/5963_1 /TAXON_ID=385413 /ORGANISM="Thalassiosira miniscula, Strain CCMP1093" /LENGTH=419 /DNA_ID=CAMNT_0025938349 /DNA_START=336 /DNA_END=1595 /DNA_ORIENTATION=-
MKVSSIALLASFVTSAEALSFRDLVAKVTRRDASASAAAPQPDADAAVVVDGAADQNERDLASNCWGTTTPAAAWHPVYSAGWSQGYCRFTVDCNSPSFSTELACCKGAYSGQVSGYCVSQLPNPPTISPTPSGGLSVYYPDYDRAWPEGICINTRPMPSGRPTYSTMLACCKGAYGGQMSGKCLSQLPSPPTTAPTTSSFEADFWYPDYDTAWSMAGCKNTLPLPYNNIGDRPNYRTQLACCKAAYGGQMSGVCISQLPNPPTMSPTDASGADFWYPDYETTWSDAGCKNERPPPFNPGDRPVYSTRIQCCKSAYGGQMSGKCLSELPNPPTVAPTPSGGLSVFYPDYSKAWPEGVCVNARPMPSGRPTYGTKESCCNGAYGGQTSQKCLCDAVGVCHSCVCGTQAERDAQGCALTCS